MLNILDHKKCSTSLAIKKIQIKMNFYLIWVKIALINSTNNKCWQGCRRKEGTFVHCFWECKLVKTLWKTVWSFLKKLKTDLSFDPVISDPGIYSKECKSGYRIDICTPMFTSSLVTIDKLWKKPRCCLDKLRIYGVLTQYSIFQP
jgi:hypothetical protein